MNQSPSFDYYRPIHAPPPLCATRQACPSYTGPSRRNIQKMPPKSSYPMERYRSVSPMSEDGYEEDYSSRDSSRYASCDQRGGHEYSSKIPQSSGRSNVYSLLNDHCSTPVHLPRLHHHAQDSYHPSLTHMPPHYAHTRQLPRTYEAPHSGNFVSTSSYHADAHERGMVRAPSSAERYGTPSREQRREQPHAAYLEPRAVQTSCNTPATLPASSEQPSPTSTSSMLESDDNFDDDVEWRQYIDGTATRSICMWPIQITPESEPVACGFTSRKHATKRHIETTHLKIKRWRCTECSKYFTQKASLTRHQSLHTGDMPFKCLYCPTTFNDRARRHRHMVDNHSLVPKPHHKQKTAGQYAE